MPRPHLPSHLSLRRLKSNSSDPGTPPDRSRNASPTRWNMPNGAKSPNEQRNGEHKGSGLVLRVQVLKGRNLAAKDKSGTSDPYLVVTLGDAKEATSVVSKTLNPEWNQTFEFPVVGGDSALLEAVCWDKDRFKKDYMGEFDVVLEDVFGNANTASEPKWYKLESRKSGKKKSIVTGEVLLKFSLYDPLSLTAAPQQVMQKFYGVVADTPDERAEDDLDDEMLARLDSHEMDDLYDERDEQVPSDETDDGKRTPAGPEEAERTRKKHRLRRLKRKSKLKAYEFSGMSDVAGVLFVEIQKITDLPPEKNLTKTSFDMDPFVVTTLGKKTYRTRVIRHNLNPVFDEKLVFQVQKHETNFSLNFAVVDRDKFSGNDFVGTTNFPVENVKSLAPVADEETGLYKLPDPPDSSSGTLETHKRRFRLPMSRSTSQTNLGRLSRTSSQTNLSSNKLGRTTSSTSLSHLNRPTLKKEDSNVSVISSDAGESNAYQSQGPTSAPSQPPANPTSQPKEYTSKDMPDMDAATFDNAPGDDPELNSYVLPLDLKNKQRWEDKHKPTLYIRAKYLPYQALRQQFWRAMLRQYDADESGRIDKVELTTMLDTLGSTLHNSTIDGFFRRFTADNGGEEILTMDQAVICLEDQLTKYPRRPNQSPAIKAQPGTSTASTRTLGNGDSSGASTPYLGSSDATPLNNKSQLSLVPVLEVSDLSQSGEQGDELPQNDLVDEEDPKGEEHVVEIHECPICHQPRLSKRNSTDADIITHIATCASSDWRAVNNIVMAGFVTSSQAQRKWYSKVITKISYGGYKLGANSANILVQDRMTGIINEERMSVYVRLGIRLMYKGLKSREMEKRKTRKLLRSLSFKQGRKYDDPASAAQIPSFINFHQLDMSEVLRPTSEFKNFNEFFYRKLKPDARPCSAPDNPNIIVSPADCRSVVFNRMEEAQKIWVKGREFSVERLLGKAYPEDAKKYHGGALGIMRLAPQDYHRFHIPIDGIMGEPKLIEGEYYTVNPMAIRSALDVYGENIRVIVPIDSVKHGRVMVVCVGAMMVGSTIITRKAGERVGRAEELGYFKFGGSTLLLLFEPGVMQFDDDLVANSNGALETLLRVGMSIGHSPDHGPHTPDMKKDNPTAAEKQEAKRRIEGSFAPTTGTGLRMPMGANMK